MPHLIGPLPRSRRRTTRTGVQILPRRELPEPWMAHGHDDRRHVTRESCQDRRRRTLLARNPRGPHQRSSFTRHHRPAGPARAAPGIRATAGHRREKFSRHSCVCLYFFLWVLPSPAARLRFDTGAVNGSFDPCGDYAFVAIWRRARLAAVWTFSIDTRLGLRDCRRAPR